MYRHVFVLVTVLSCLGNIANGQLQRNKDLLNYSHKTATLKDGRTVSAAILDDTYGSYPCNGANLRFIICSQYSSCSIASTCRFFPESTVIPSIVLGIAVSGNTVYVTTDASEYSVIKCDISGTTLTSCVLQPLLKASHIIGDAQIVFTPTASKPTQVHVIYGSYETSGGSYVLATVCDTDLVRCSFRNISSITKSNYINSEFSHPSSVVIGSNIHIATLSDDELYGAILTCNWDGYTSCKVYKFLYDPLWYQDQVYSNGILSNGIASVYTGGVYYLFYTVDYGYHTDLTMRTCDITGSSVSCSYRYSLYYELDVIMYDTPSITPVPYLGSIIAAVQLLNKNQVLIVKYEIGSQITSTTTNLTLPDSLESIELPQNEQTRVTTCLTSASFSYRDSTFSFYTTYMNMFPGVADPPMPPPSPPPPLPPPRLPPFRPPPNPSRRPPPRKPPPGTRMRTPPPPKSPVVQAKPSPPPLSFKRPPPQKQPPRQLPPPLFLPKRPPPRRQSPPSDKPPPLSPPKRPPPKRQPPPSNKPPPLSPPKRPPPKRQPPPSNKPPPLSPPKRPPPKRQPPPSNKPPPLSPPKRPPPKRQPPPSNKPPLRLLPPPLSPPKRPPPRKQPPLQPPKQMPNRTANTASRKLQKHIRGYARRRLHSNATAIYDVNNMHGLTPGNATN